MCEQIDYEEQGKAAVLPKEWLLAARKAADIVLKGGVILYPTDTIWGLGCDATNEAAVKRVYDIKKRTDDKAMLLLIDHEAKLPGLVASVPFMAYALLDAAIRPLTIIYPAARNVASTLIPKEGTIGIRITKEPFSQALCKAAGVPLVSTSANISGSPAPSTFAEISKEIITQVDYVVPVRQEERACHHASEIIALGANNEVKVIRTL